MNKLFEQCKDEQVIKQVLKINDYWKPIIINNVKYYRTFQDNVVFSSHQEMK